MSTYTLAVALPPASPSLPSEVGNVGDEGGPAEADAGVQRRRSRGRWGDGRRWGASDRGRRRTMDDEEDDKERGVVRMVTFSLISPFAGKREKNLRVVGPRGTFYKGIINKGNHNNKRSHHW